jgi:hypothetical protein
VTLLSRRLYSLFSFTLLFPFWLVVVYLAQKVRIVSIQKRMPVRPPNAVVALVEDNEGLIFVSR